MEEVTVELAEEPVSTSRVAFAVDLINSTCQTATFDSDSCIQYVGLTFTEACRLFID